MDRMDVMGKDLVSYVDLKATAAEKNHIGIKQMDVMGAWRKTGSAGN